MADTELESMIVKLKGDATSYEKMVKDAESSIRRMTGTMKGEDTKIQDQARRAATAVMNERKRVEQEGERERKRIEKERERDAQKNSIGANLNAAWSITEKSFIQSIRSVDAMLSRTVASITNGLEGIVRVSLAAGARITKAWSDVFNKVTLGFTGMVGRWVGSLGGMASRLGGMIDKVFMGIPSAIATTLGGVSQIVGTVLAGAFGIAGAAVVAFGAEMTRVFHETMDLSKQAKALGLTILDLRAGVLWAGVGMSTFTNILGNVQTKITELKQGSVATTREFRNFSALANRSIDQIAGGGWETIIDALGAIPDSAQRASVAFSILGSEADKILGAIQKGGVGEAKSLAKRLGLDVDPASMQSLRQIAQFTREVEALKTGLVNQVMLGLAPIAAELSSIFSLSKVDITWIKDRVTEIGLEIGKWGAIIATVFSDPKLFFEAIGVIGDAFINMATQFWEVMTKKTDEWIGKYSYWLNPGVRFRSGPEEESLIRTPGTDPREARSRSFMERLEDSPIMKRFREFQEAVGERRKQPPEALDKNKTPPIAIEKLNQSFDQLISSLKQPIEAWKQSLVDLKRFTDAGKFQGLGNQQAMMAAQMFRQLKESTGMAGSPMFAGAATAGSTEAYSAIAQFNAMRDRGDIQQQIKTSLDTANRQRDAQIAQGEKVITALNKMGENILRMEDNEVEL